MNNPFTNFNKWAEQTIEKQSLIRIKVFLIELIALCITFLNDDLISSCYIGKYGNSFEIRQPNLKTYPNYTCNFSFDGDSVEITCAIGINVYYRWTIQDLNVQTELDIKTKIVNLLRILKPNQKVV